MEYKRFGDRIVARIDRGEEIIEKLIELAAHERVTCASINALGAADELTVGVYSVATQTFQATDYCGECELSALVGTITQKDGAPYAHIHATAFAADGRMLGGHLKRARVSATCEAVITCLDGTVMRAHDNETGLELMQFSS